MNSSQFEFLVAEFSDQCDSRKAILKEPGALEDEIQQGIENLKAMPK